MLIIFLSLLVYVDAHGRFTSPAPRAYTGGGGPNAPTYTCGGPAFGNTATSMRCHSMTTPGTKTTVTAGQKLTVTWTFEAAHPGDCSIWISYDTNQADPANWVKLKDLPGCLAPDGKTPQITTTTVDIPKNIPNCAHCVMRWEWYAVQQVSNVEFYVQCFDVTIVGGNDACPKPSPTTAIGDIKYLGACPFYNPYNGAFDKKRSRGPSAYVAPSTCGGVVTPTTVVTKAPTKTPTAAPTTLSPTKKGETRSPTTPPTTRSPTTGAYVPPPTTAADAAAGYPLSAKAQFNNKLLGEVLFVQYGPVSKTSVTVSLKTKDGSTMLKNEIQIKTTCTGFIFNPTGAKLGSSGCVGCLSSRQQTLNGGFDGKISNPTNVQPMVDGVVRLTGTNNVIDKYVVIVDKSGGYVDCGKIVAGFTPKPSTASQHSVNMFSIVCLICAFFIFF